MQLCSYYFVFIIVFQLFTLPIASVVRCFNGVVIQRLEKTKNRQYRDTGNIVHTRHMTKTKKTKNAKHRKLNR